MSWFNYGTYVSAAEKKERAAKKIKELAKKGQSLNPISIMGRKIASTFWGKAWCDNLESYRDYEYRLPRGRTYIRNGAVIDLTIEKGKIVAHVQGSSLYKVTIEIASLSKKNWAEITKECMGKIASMIELLQGKFSQNVMAIITDPKKGLFPKSDEIKLDCSCPDYATMCKHVAAVLYGVGARLDTAPETLFVLRSVDHLELINTSSFTELAKSKKATQTMDDHDLSVTFGIEIDNSADTKNNATKNAVFKPARKADVKKPVLAKEKGKRTPPKTTLSKIKPIKKKTVKKKRRVAITVKPVVKNKKMSKKPVKPAKVQRKKNKE